MNIDQFIFSGATEVLGAGSVGYESPSNIALVKYWGKHGQQLPKNPSISFTLDHCKTTTQLDYAPRNDKKTGDYAFTVELDGQIKPGFAPKITQFMSRIERFLPFLTDYQFTIKTSNSFPHSSGIASSASGMSALALCFMEMERKLNPAISAADFLRKASFLARLGSGSACRSLEGPLVVWGKHESVPQSSAYYGTSFRGSVAPIFNDFQDTILLVDVGQKQVSSTVGHDLMNGHPFAEKRFEQAVENLEKLLNILKNGDLKAFIHLVESEALTLHAMMMTSSPYFILIKENTLAIINKIWDFRKETGTPVCFTLDAGANVHMLYPKAESEKVLAFIKSDLAEHCQDRKFICDQVGRGARKIE